MSDPNTHPDSLDGLLDELARRRQQGCETTADAATGSPPPAARPGAALPNRLGDYQILREVGRGGMGVVYEAEQVSLGRRVALKVLPLHAARDAHALERFRREARAAAKLHHTNIVPVYEVGQDGDTVFYAMQFIEGRGLDRVIAGLRPRPAEAAPETETATLPDKDGRHFRQAAALVRQAAEALDFAHARGVVHRDVKPSNLLLDESGVVWVADFGLAKAGGDDLTATGALLGTVRYMAPERFRGAGDQRADVYALGLTLYELLVLRPAFHHPDEWQLIEQIKTLDPPRPRDLDPAVPRDLETVCLKAIDKDPARRYQSAGAMAEDLGRFLDDRPITARRVGPAERLARWAHRNPLVALLTAAVVFSLVFGSAFAGYWALEADASATNFKNKAQEAKDAAELAGVKEQEAKNSTRAALDAEKETRKAKDLLAHRLYGSEMYASGLEWDQSLVGLVRSRLAGLVPKEGEPDLRGFEWHYRQRLLGSDLRTLRGHTGIVTAMAFSPDGARLVSCGKNEKTRLWDTVTGRELRTWDGGPFNAISLSFSPDGRKLAVLGESTWQVKIRDADTGKEERTLGKKEWFLLSLAFQPGTQEITVGVMDQQTGGRLAVVWDVSTGREVRRLPVTSQFLAYSPDGKRLAGAGDDGVKVWDASTGELKRTLSGGPPKWQCVAFSPDGRYVAAGKENFLSQRPDDAGQAYVWDAETGKEVLRFREPGGTEALAFAPGGRLAASISWMGTLSGGVKVWDLATAREILTLPREGDGYLNEHGDAVPLAFSPDGRRLACAGGPEHAIRIRDVNLPPESLPLNGMNTVAFSPDGKSLVSGQFNRPELVVRDTETGKTLDPFRGPGGWYGVSYSPDGRYLAGGGNDNVVTLWDAKTRRVVRTLTPSGPPNSHHSLRVVFSADGKRLASGGFDLGKFDKAVRVFDVESGEELLKLTGHQGSVNDLAFSPDGTRLASVADFPNRTGPAGELKVWDLTTGKEVFAYTELSARMLGVAYSPTEPLLAVPGASGVIRLLDPDGREVRRLVGHARTVWNLAFSGDGRRLASGGDDSTVRVWDPATGQELLTLRGGHLGSVTRIAFSSDGRRIASADQSGILRLWDAAPPTAEAETWREARGAVEYLLGTLHVPKAEALARLRKDATLPDAVRAAALELAAADPRP